MNKSVQQGVGNCLISKHIIPVFKWQLTCYYCRTFSVLVFDNFQHIQLFPTQPNLQFGCCLFYHFTLTGSLTSVYYLLFTIYYLLFTIYYFTIYYFSLTGSLTSVLPFFPDRVFDPCQGDQPSLTTNY